MFDNVQIIMGKHLDTVEHACSQCCFLICFRFVKTSAVKHDRNLAFMSETEVGVKR